MVIIDASVVIAWLASPSDDRVRGLLATGQGALAPVTVTELLSGKTAGEQVARLIDGLHKVPLRQGYWERAGRLRASVLQSGRKAGLGDALLAQVCLDHDLPLLTRDRDFAAFAAISGLKLA